MQPCQPSTHRSRIDTQFSSPSHHAVRLSLAIMALAFVVICKLPVQAATTITGTASAAVAFTPNTGQVVVQPQTELRYTLRHDKYRLDAAGFVRATFSTKPTIGKWEADVHRLALKLYLPQADVTVGRQPLQWGAPYPLSVANVWALSAPSPLKTEVPSGDGISVRIPTGDLDFIDVVGAQLVGETNTRWALRYHSNWHGYDYGVFGVKTGASAHAPLDIGAECRGDLGLLGMAVELRHRVLGLNQGLWQMYLAVDGNWLNRVTWQAAYLATPTDTPAWWQGRHTLNLGASIGMNEITQVSANVISNLDTKQTTYSALGSMQLGGGWQAKATATADASGLTNLYGILSFDF